MQDTKSLNLKGLILTSICYGNFEIAKKDIINLNIPVVVLNEEVKAKNIFSIILDDFKGGYDGAKYLMDMGHKKIAIVRGIFKDIEDRFKGCKQAMKDNSISLDENYILQAEAATEPAAYNEIIKLIEKGNIPTAIFALDDEMAIGAIRALKEKGIRCPEDVSVLGYDGMEISNFAVPRLTTMVRPVFEMGKKAVEILLGDETRRKVQCIKMEAKLIERESCEKK